MRLAKIPLSNSVATLFNRFPIALLGAALWLFLSTPSVAQSVVMPVPRLINNSSNVSGYSSSGASAPIDVFDENSDRPSEPPAGSLDEASPIERRAFERTNDIRRKNGLPPLEWDPALWRIARRHSGDMARLGFFSHASPDGRRVTDRAKEAGIVHFRVIAENIAYNCGYDDPAAYAVNEWMSSPGHRANILFPAFQLAAVGAFVSRDGSVYLTQTFLAQ